MGKAKLNVWIRDEKCRVVINTSQLPQWDWVEISNCMGDVIKHITLPVGEAHVEVEVPPGCYVAQGHICMTPEAAFNGYTDKAIVMAGCNQDLCVDLIIPVVGTCVERDLHPFVTQALRLGVPRIDIVTTARTMLRAGQIEPAQAVKRVDRIIAEAKKMKAELAVKDFSGTLDILKEIKQR